MILDREKYQIRVQMRNNRGRDSVFVLASARVSVLSNVKTRTTKSISNGSCLGSS